jgi:hypothetical protein
LPGLDQASSIRGRCGGGAGDQELLPPGGGEEALEAVVLDGEAVLLLQIE